MIFEPLDFISRAKRGKSKKVKTPAGKQEQTPAERRTSMIWAQRLKRVFNIDVETCSECGGGVRIIACIEDPAVSKILVAKLSVR